MAYSYPSRVSSPGLCCVPVLGLRVEGLELRVFRDYFSFVGLVVPELRHPNLVYCTGISLGFKVQGARVHTFRPLCSSCRAASCSEP